MNRHSLYFTAPRQVEIRPETLPPLAPDQVLVKTVCSAISSGTELLVYRGEAPTDLASDETIVSLGGTLSFPLKYGYSVVGRIVELGADVDKDWQDKLVFSFNPHETFFVSPVNNLIRPPVDLDPQEALFIPNLETAVNFLHDGAPLVGERVAVFGQGIVGLLTTQLLSRIPGLQLCTFDRYPLRRELSLKAGAAASLDPNTISNSLILQSSSTFNFDLSYELSGSPAALEQALAVTGFAGRVVIGSWYGTKQVSLDLGGRFHRSRIKLMSSQVSTLTPDLMARWTKARRFETVMQLLPNLQPQRYITHRFPFSQAADAYRLLDQQPDQAVQVVFDYD
jgi:2-desacetyl-2-hydroxyethyl bacteriochlorophyllide A dehydrogenase